MQLEASIFHRFVFFSMNHKNYHNMKLTFFVPAIISAFMVMSCTTQEKSVSDPFQDGDLITLQKDILKDKIMGGWAGQTIGCTYGGPTEFRFQGTMIQDYQPIPWYDGVIKWWYENSPGLYDDVYMDLTFVDVFDRLGLDAPADSFAVAFATADYMLWHANQAARYNILRGIMPPESGHWTENPHSDDIDYQIEADYAGIMSPGMINTASRISDKIGHIMNYGDGWYGGVYVGAMYSLAFISDDIEYIVTRALESIPAESEYYKCIRQVIDSWKQNPDDWMEAWFELQKNWSDDIGCPEGAIATFDIDSKINSAYIVIGLLYGKGDFSQTLDIATRCGQDSDCNPASAGGILGTMLGYSNIPDLWKKEVKPVEDMDFKYTTISLNDVYRMSFDQALENISRNGGEVEDAQVKIKFQSPKAVAFEKGFPNMFPVERKRYNWDRISKNNVASIEFDGTGLVIDGGVQSDVDGYVAEMEFTLDGAYSKTMKMPVSYTTRTPEMYWAYNLKKGHHSVEMKWVNPEKTSKVSIGNVLIYSDEPFKKVFEEVME